MMFRSVLWCVLVPWSLWTEASLSGFYVENSLEQTVVEHVLTRQEKREVEHEILNILGLPNRPRAVSPATLASSAPKFLLDVYKSLLEPTAGRAPRSEFNLSGQDLHAIDESDVIMSFASHSHHSTAVRHERGKRLWFDVSEVPSGENIVGAELRLYQIAQILSPLVTFTVTAYQLISVDQGQKELQYVDAVNTTSDNEGWLILNVTGPLTSWVAFPSSNLGLYLSVHITHRPGHEIRPEELGIVGEKGEKQKQPFMVAFFKVTGHDNVHVRRTRDTGRNRNKKADSESSYPRNPLYDSSMNWSSRSCQIQTLYVSFKDLEWQDWIIAPEGYHAFIVVENVTSH